MTCFGGQNGRKMTPLKKSGGSPYFIFILSLHKGKPLKKEKKRGKKGGK